MLKAKFIVILLYIALIGSAPRNIYGQASSTITTTDPKWKNLFQDTSTKIAMYNVYEKTGQVRFLLNEIMGVPPAINNKTKILTIDPDPVPSHCADYCTKKGEIEVSFHAGGLNNTYESGLVSWKYSVDINVTCKDAQGNTVYSLISQTLIIDNNTPEQRYIKDLTPYFPPNCTAPNTAAIATIDINISNAQTITGNTSVLPRIRIDGSYRHELDINATSQSVVSTPQVVLKDVKDEFLVTDYIETYFSTRKNPVRFEWYKQCPADVYPNYQFQLLRLYNTEPNYATTAHKIHATIDWDKALTIETGSDKREVTLTIPEGSGFYIWRVRPIGNHYPGGASHPGNWGQWSNFPQPLSGDQYAYADLDTSITPMESIAWTAPYYFFYHQFDNQINWSYNRSFAENSLEQVKTFESINFYNALLGIQQGQVKNQSINKVLLGQTVYDFSGRPSLQSMAAPASPEKMQYIPNGVRNANGTMLYGPESFDKDATGTSGIMLPESMKSNGSGPLDDPISKYYSNNNPDISVPNAKDYPFSRTIFYDDGRVKEQSGVGADHTIGSGHTVKVYYAAVADEELMSIFGDEAPSAISCTKKVIIDENGTASVEYRDKEGHIIATCLTNNGELNQNYNGSLVKLDETVDPVNQITAKFTLPEGIKEGDYVYRSSKNITVLGQTDITVSYIDTLKTFTEWCLNYCSTCDYTVDVYIRNIEDLQQASVPVKTWKYNTLHKGNNLGNECEGIGPASIGVPEGNQPTPPPGCQSPYLCFNYQLPGAGTYSIEKIVTINKPQVRTTAPLIIQPPLNTVLENHHQDAFAGITTLQTILNDLLLDIPGNDYSQKLADYNAKRTQNGNSYQIETERISNSGCMRIDLPEGKCEDFSGCTSSPVLPKFEEYLYQQTNIPKATNTLNKFFRTADNQDKYPPGFPLILNDPLSSTPNGPYILGQGMFDQLIRNIIVDRASDPNICQKLWENWQTSVAMYKIYADANGNPGKVDKVDGVNKVEGTQYFDLLEFFLDASGVRMDASGQFQVCQSSASPYDPTTGYLLNAHKVMQTPDPNSECALRLYYISFNPTVSVTFGSSWQGDCTKPWGQLYACQKDIPDMSKQNDLLEKPPCEIPTAAYSPTNPDWICYVRWQRHLAQKVTTACLTDCEQKRPYFEEAVRNEYHKLVPPKYIIGEIRPGTNIPVVKTDADAVPEVTWLCQIENLISNCGSGCTTTQQVDGNGNPVGPWASPAELNKIQVRNSGWFDVKFPNPTCEPGYEPSSSSAAQKIDILIKYLNKVYKEHQQLGYVHNVDFSFIGYWFLRNSGWFDGNLSQIPSCFHDLLVSQPTSSPLPVGGLYITVYPNLPGKFYRTRSGGSIGCPEECGIEFTQEVPIFEEGNKKRDMLNTYLNSAWGKSISGFIPTDSIGTNKLRSSGSPQYYIYSKISKGSTNDSLGKLAAASSTKPILDSLTFYGVNGRTDSMPMFVSSNLGDTLYNNTIGVIGTRYTDAFAIRDSSGSISAWKAFGTIVIQLPRDTTSDPVEKVVIRLTGLPSFEDSTVLGKIVLTTTYIGKRDTSAWSTTLTMEEFLALSNGSFSNSIGKFYISSTGYLRYGNIIAGEEINEYTNLVDVKIDPTFEEKGNKISKSVSWKLDCDLSALCTASDCGICIKWDFLQKPVLSADKATTIVPKTCEQMELERIKNYISQKYDEIIQERKNSLTMTYLRDCEVSAIRDKITISVPLKNYHYTLYYYDRAGNLVKTVPPKGVVASALYTRNDHPAHTFVTEYEYTSLGQLKRNKTPDGGETKYWYNRQTGQLRFSQNAKQKESDPGRYSYTKYDKLGRVVETGETSIAGSTDPQTLADATNTNPALVYPVVSTNPREQVTTLVYTASASALPSPYTSGPVQANTLNRLSYALYEGDLGTIDDNTATYYSYDVHGNVQWVIQDVAGIGASKTEYEYNLVSGNVTKVKYREGKSDRFYHQYEYDADNRLKSVQTSRDGRIWEQDANYSYFDHGPMKRTVIGEDSVQAVDYTYTIQGWLKGINHPALDKDYDPGKDGTVPPSNQDRATVATDAFGMTLGYFPGDFDRYSGSVASSFNSTTTYPSKYHLPIANALYNGNITTWSSNTKASGATGLQFEGLTGGVYRYDMLNRLLTDDFRKWNPSTDLWTTVTDNPYSSSYSYDANGNLKTIKRKAIDGTAVKQIDDISFDYANPTTDNKLDRVTDAGLVVAGFTDIKNGQNTGNYEYYPDGSLKKDTQEGIDNIEWTVYGKVSKITKSNGTTIQFYYDATGKRVKKEVIDPQAVSGNKRTFYIYDAGGNLIATYDQLKVTNGWAAVTVLNEWMIYGAGRVGMADPHGSGIAREFGHPSGNEVIFTRYLNKKQYELTDHLGNVRAVIGDVKIPDNGSFVANLFGYTNYYPFGMEQPGRTWNSADFRFGYNGVEKDNELKGIGNNIFTEFRNYDPRLGRWLSRDPIVKTWESPYAGMANNPLIYADPSGLDVWDDISEFFMGRLSDPLNPGTDGLFKDIANLFSGGINITDTQIGIENTLFRLDMQMDRMFQNSHQINSSGFVQQGEIAAFLFKRNNKIEIGPTKFFPRTVTRDNEGNEKINDNADPHELEQVQDNAGIIHTHKNTIGSSELTEEQFLRTYIPGVAPSFADIRDASKRGQGRISIIEAGSARFVIEVIDAEKAAAFALTLTNNSPLDQTYQNIAHPPRGATGTIQSRILDAAKEIINQPDSGLRLYKTLGESKTLLEVQK